MTKREEISEKSNPEKKKKKVRKEKRILKKILQLNLF